MSREQCIDEAVRRVVRRFYPMTWREALQEWSEQVGGFWSINYFIVLEFNRISRGLRE